MYFVALRYPPRIRLFKLNKEPEIKESSIPSHLIQIKANAEEINTRIDKFITRKRQEINESNIRDFCGRNTMEEVDSTCARIDAKLMKRKDSKGHLQGIVYY